MVRTRTCNSSGLLSGPGTRRQMGVSGCPRGAGWGAVSAGAGAAGLRLPLPPLRAAARAIFSSIVARFSWTANPLLSRMRWAETEKRWGWGVAGPRPAAAAGSVGGRARAWGARPR